jgi:hypothetical protein
MKSLAQTLLRGCCLLRRSTVGVHSWTRVLDPFLVQGLFLLFYYFLKSKTCHLKNRQPVLFLVEKVFCA